MADEKPKPLMTRFFHGCLLLLGSIVALWVAFDLLSRFWGWLLVIAVVVGTVIALIWYMRWRRGRRW